MKLQIPTCHLLDAPLRKASVLIMIIMKEFLFSIRFISSSTNLKHSIDIFIMSKLIKQAIISSLSAAARWSLL